MFERFLRWTQKKWRGRAAQDETKEKSIGDYDGEIVECERKIRTLKDKRDKLILSQKNKMLLAEYKSYSDDQLRNMNLGCFNSIRYNKKTIENEEFYIIQHLLKNKRFVKIKNQWQYRSMVACFSVVIGVYNYRSDVILKVGDLALLRLIEWNLLNKIVNAYIKHEKKEAPTKRTIETMNAYISDEIEQNQKRTKK